MRGEAKEAGRKGNEGIGIQAKRRKRLRTSAIKEIKRNKLSFLIHHPLTDPLFQKNN